jgi:hypothetical protein
LVVSLFEIAEDGRQNPEQRLEGIDYRYQAPEHVTHDLSAEHVLEVHCLVDGG